MKVSTESPTVPAAIIHVHPGSLVKPNKMLANPHSGLPPLLGNGLEVSPLHIYIKLVLCPEKCQREGPYTFSGIVLYYW